MEFLIDLFFKTDYTNLPFVLSRIAVFVLLSAFIIWLLWVILSKVMYKKNETLPKEYKLKLALMWSLIWYYIIFSIYLFFFFKRNGIDAFHWSNPQFYLEISGHLISIIASIGWYLIKQFQLAKELK
jgi:hypothetical protein